MKKGFFFSLSAIMLLTFAVVSITQHLSVVRENEMFYSDLISLTSYQTVFSNFNTNSLSTMLGAVGKFALFKMANYTAFNPIDAVGADNYTNIRLVFQELVNNGNAPISYFSNESYAPLNYTSSERNNTLRGIADQLNRNFNAIGYNTNEISFTITNISMASPSSVNITADIIINVSDSLGRSSYFASYRNFTSNISIEGLPDPLANSYVAKENLNRGGSNLSRWFLFRHDRDDLIYDFDPAIGTHTTDAEAGQGWFYGPIISAEDAAREDPQYPELFVLYGNFTEIMDLGEEKWGKYGAYIITSGISYESNCCEDNCSENIDLTFNPTEWYDSGGTCRSRPYSDGTYILKPFIVAPEFDASDLVGANFENEMDPAEKTVFFATGNDPESVSVDPKKKNMATARFLGIEGLRDQFICDYYYKTGMGPNFLQRMLVEGYSMADPDNGITSMYVEKEFLGDGMEYNGYSSADFEFMRMFNSRSPGGDLVVVRGMPGCKSRDVCMLTSSLRSIIMTEGLSVDLGIPSALTCDLNDRECWGVQ